MCDSDVGVFGGIVGSAHVLTADKGDDLDPYNVDWLHNHRWVWSLLSNLWIVVILTIGYASSL